jgi:predicted kinase
MSRDYTEQYVDYSNGRDNPPTLTVVVGISGSGKTVLTRGWILNGYGRVLRFNRDNLRAMMYPGVTWDNGGKRNEDIVRRYEQEGVKAALRAGHVTEVIVDDTNCVLRTRHGWEEIARDARAKFRLVLMTTSLEDCIERDSKRTGTECVGEKVIRGQYKTLCEATVTPKMYDVLNPLLNRAECDRQAVKTGEFTRRLSNRPFILCDVDGTLANHVGIRSPFDESKVLLDTVHTPVADWVRELYPQYNIVILSGRQSSCCEDTVAWLEGYHIPFDFILMRSAGDRRSDAVIKPELLSDLLTTIRKDEIEFVIDDRPRVLRAWLAAGLKVQPVYMGEKLTPAEFTTEHTADCKHKGLKDYRRCVCGALEDF